MNLAGVDSRVSVGKIGERRPNCDLIRAVALALDDHGAVGRGVGGAADRRAIAVS